jgi:8-oxo-dGTP diphosphatase
MSENETKLTQTVVGYLVRGNEVLLGERLKTEWEHSKHLLAGIGGKVGDKPELKDETNEAAFIREIQEEIQVTPTRYVSVGRVIFLFPAKPKWSQEVEIFIVDEWEGEPTETAEIRPEWYPKDRLPFEQMWDDARYYLPQVLAGKTVNAVFTYGEDNRTVVDAKLS